MTTEERIQRLEARVQQLEEMVSLAKARCKKCGAILVILPTTEYLDCAGKSLETLGHCSQDFSMR
jgi:hypothetical protein